MGDFEKAIAILEEVKKIPDVHFMEALRLLKSFREKITQTSVSKDPFAGLFQDEPELMDRLIEDIMKSREKNPLRITKNE